ncbi:hypothetical protein QBC38DRAFT_287552 [Podospora fimiseda]|uniref:Uncharacterized protein n=1 Tax=Podospora fimiseda TaxID=252190 RepID=A0AAN7BK66_9PEZI|nr:hypothetical protein QBC38DRAFT_287552 [Podospora fimiseda]
MEYLAFFFLLSPVPGFRKEDSEPPGVCCPSEKTVEEASVEGVSTVLVSFSPSLSVAGGVQMWLRAELLGRFSAAVGCLPFIAWSWLCHPKYGAAVPSRLACCNSRPEVNLFPLQPLVLPPAGCFLFFSLSFLTSLCLLSPRCPSSDFLPSLLLENHLSLALAAGSGVFLLPLFRGWCF